MKISIIIPTYKPKDYIYECLDSLENQTLDKNEFEVILILNGDREPYEEEIKKYLKTLTIQTKLLYSKIQGVSNARNLGLDLSNGENIIFIDDDDFISFNYLKKLLEAKIDEYTIIQSNVNDFYDNPSKKYDFKSRNYRANYTEKNLIKFKFLGALSVVSAKLISKKIIDDVKFNTKFSNGEDTLFFSEISKNVKAIKTVDEENIYYRRKRNNSLHFVKRSKIEKIINLINLTSVHLKILCTNTNNKKFILYRTGSLLVRCFR